MEKKMPKLNRWRAMAGGAGVVGMIAMGVLMAGPISAQTQTKAAPGCTVTSLGGWGAPTVMAGATPSLGLGFTNISHKSCSLGGYPHVQMLNKAGKDLFTFDKNATAKVETVVLAKGQTAYFRILYVKTGKGSCPMSASLGLTPPGSRAAITLHGPAAEIRAYGSNKVPCGQLTIEPVQSARP